MGLSGGARAAPVIVPAEFRDGLIYVRVSIRPGVPGLFLLDTGAAITVLDARFAARSGVASGDAVNLRGGGGHMRARQAEDVGLRLAGEPEVLTDPLVADLSRAGRGLDAPLDGILGDDVLRRFVVTLDYRSGQVRLAPPGETTPPPDAESMRLIATPFVSATVQEGGQARTASFQIDTGSNTAVEFWGPFARQTFPRPSTRPGVGLGVAGTTYAERGSIDALVVAGRRIVRPDVNFADMTRPDDAGSTYAGVIGGPAWSGLVLTLDFAARRVWLR